MLTPPTLEDGDIVIRQERREGMLVHVLHTTPGADPDMPHRKSIPTQVGDVLILRTDHPSAIYGVGRVSQDGQQDFHGGVNVEHVRDRAAAVAKAKALVQPGRRIFLLNLDSGGWSEISG